MSIRLLPLFLIFLNYSMGWAEPAVIGPPIGHFAILKFEKNVNPENILMVYTIIDEDCYFKPDLKNPKFPVLDFYWLMSGAKFKRTNSIIKHNIRKKIQIDPYFKMGKNTTSFPILINQLAEINPDFKDSRLIVKSKRYNEQCFVSAYLKSKDPSWDGFQIKKIYSETKKTLIPPFHKVFSIRIEGINPLTEKTKTKIYLAK